MKNSSFRYQRHQSNTFLPVVTVRMLLFSAVFLALVSSLRGDEIDVWIGSGKAGIFYLKLDTENGRLSAPTIVSETPGAGFLAMHPNGKVLYATDGDDQGSVAAFSIWPLNEIAAQLAELESKEKEVRKTFGDDHATVKQAQAAIKNLKKMNDDSGNARQLKLLNKVSTGDGGAACVGVDQTGSVLMSAQYGGGSTSIYTLEENGSLGERVDVIEHGEGSKANPRRQATAHPHWVGTSPDNRFLMVPDLGLDRVVVYEIDLQTAKLKPHARIPVPPGSGPRHMKFHTSGQYAYVLNELTLTVSVFEYDAANATFSDIQLIETLPEDQKDKHLNSAAEIRVHPNGRFVYTSNRGHDSITVFSVDQATGKLTLVEREPIRGATPRNFNIDPSGKWLIAAGQGSNTLAVFEIDQESGELTYSRQSVNVPAPICVLFGSK